MSENKRSIGEDLNKLSILEIKLNKVKDIKIDDEFILLNNNLSIYKYNFWYDKLKEINETIWDINDKLKTPNNDFKKLSYNKIIEKNRIDRIKVKIDNFYKITCREVNCDKMLKCLFISHFHMGDQFFINGAIRYISTLYDEVYLVCKNEIYNNLKIMYSDDKSIKFYCINIDYNEMITKNKILEIQDDLKIYDLYLSGNSKISYDGTNYFDNKFPEIYYEHLNLNINIMFKYYYVNNEKNNLYDIIKNFNYILVHEKSFSMTREIDIISTIQNPNDYLIININRNIYEKTHKYYSIAENFVNRSIFDYIDVIKNASKIYCIDSLLYCLCNLYDSNALEKYVYFPSYNYKNFIEIKKAVILHGNNIKIIIDYFSKMGYYVYYYGDNLKKNSHNIFINKNFDDVYDNLEIYTFIDQKTNLTQLCKINKKISKLKSNIKKYINFFLNCKIYNFKLAQNLQIENFGNFFDLYNKSDEVNFCTQIAKEKMDIGFNFNQRVIIMLTPSLNINKFIKNLNLNNTNYLIILDTDDKITYEKYVSDKITLDKKIILSEDILIYIKDDNIIDENLIFYIILCYQLYQCDFIAIEKTSSKYVYYDCYGGTPNLNNGFSCTGKNFMQSYKNLYCCCINIGGLDNISPKIIDKENCDINMSIKERNLIYIPENFFYSPNKNNYNTNHMFVSYINKNLISITITYYENLKKVNNYFEFSISENKIKIKLDNISNKNTYFIKLNFDITPKNHKEYEYSIMQTYETNKISIKRLYSICSILSNIPDISYKFFDSKSRIEYCDKKTSLISKYMNKLISGTYKSDFFRAFYIYCEGGIYFDCKEILFNHFYDFLNKDETFSRDCINMGKTYSFTGFFYSKINNIVLKNWIKLMLYNIKNEIKCHMLEITGPMCLHKCGIKTYETNNILLDGDIRTLYVEYKKDVLILCSYNNYYEEKNYINTLHYSSLYNRGEIYDKNITINDDINFIFYDID